MQRWVERSGAGQRGCGRSGAERKGEREEGEGTDAWAPCGREREGGDARWARRFWSLVGGPEVAWARSAMADSWASRSGEPEREERARVVSEVWAVALALGHRDRQVGRAGLRLREEAVWLTAGPCGIVMRG